MPAIVDNSAAVATTPADEDATAGRSSMAEYVHHYAAASSFGPKPDPHSPAGTNSKVAGGSVVVPSSSSAIVVVAVVSGSRKRERIYQAEFHAKLYQAEFHAKLWTSKGLRINVFIQL